MAEFLVNETVLLDTPNYRVGEIRSSEDDFVVVLFSTWRHNPSLDGPAFGEQFLRKLKINVIYIKSATNDWYQGDVAPAIEVARKHIAGRTAVGYGSSMSGYAALNFSAELGLERSVLFSPQFSINGDIVPFEQRWRDEAAVLQFEHDNIINLSGIRCDIVYDPFHVDARHVKLIAARNFVNHIKLPFAGHDTAKLLRLSGVLHDVSRNLILGQSIGFMRSAIRANRRASPGYWMGMSQAFHGRGLFRQALNAAQRAAACKGGETYGVQSHLANMLLQNKQALAAVAIFERYLDKERYRNESRMWLVWCFEELGWLNLANEMKDGKPR